MRILKQVASAMAFGAAACLLTAGLVSPAAATPTAGTAATPDKPLLSPDSVDVDVYKIVIGNVNSRKCVAIPGGTLVPRTQAIQWDCGQDGDTDREWWAYDQGDDAYGNPIWVFQNVKTKMCLTAAGNSGYGAAVQYDCDLTAKYQRWSWDRASRLHSNATGDCLAVPGAQLGDGVKLIHWTCGTGREQMWESQDVLTKQSINLRAGSTPSNLR